MNLYIFYINMNKLPVELLNKIVLKIKDNIVNFRKSCLNFAVLRVKIKNKTIYYNCGEFLLKQISCEQLFNSITHLTFNYDFDQTVDNLPVTLTHLTFGHKFNQEVNNLPANLTHLKFGYNFNYTVNALPSYLTHLTFGENFNQTVDTLPTTLTHLTFGYYFNQPVDDILA